MKTTWLPLLLLLQFALSTRIYAQQANADSLLRQLAIAREDTNKVHLLHALSDIFETSEPVKAIGYTHAGKALSTQLGFADGILTSYRNLSFIYGQQAGYDSALHYNKLVYNVAVQKKDTFRIGLSLFNMGECYKLMGDYEKGLEHTLQGVHMLEGRGYTNIESNLYSGLQSTYLMLKQYDKSVQYGLKAIEAGRKLENKTPLLTALSNLANCYGEMHRNADADRLYKEAVTLAKTVQNTSTEAYIYEGLFDIALQEKRYADAKNYVTQSLQLHTLADNAAGLAAANCNFALYYLHQKDFSKAETYARTGLKITKENNYPEKEGEAAAVLSWVFLAGHRIDSAYKYDQISKEISEQIFTSTAAEKEADMRIKYETAKKETQILLQQSALQQRQTMNYVLAGIALTLLVIAILGYRNFTQRQTIQQQKITELETEKQLAATEAILQGEEQERARLAKDLHDGLGGMLSGIKHSFSNMKENLIMTPENAQAFSRGIDLLDSSIKEMRRVAHNMMPEMLVQYGLNTALKEFCLELSRSSSLHATYQPIDMDTVEFNQNLSITSYRVVQELANNTLKHAAATTLLIQAHASPKDNLLHLTVEDNGKGFDIQALEQSGGMGWKSIRNRIELVHGKIDISTAPGKGISVLIEIPLS